MEIWMSDLPLDIVPSTGPVVRALDVTSVLDRIAENTGLIRAGRFDNARTRQLLLDYLDNSLHLLVAGTTLYLERVRDVLWRHSFSLPAGFGWEGDEQSLRERLSRRGEPLGQCQFGTTHMLEDIAFFFLHDWELCSVNYFTVPVIVRHGIRCRVAREFERCRCGAWFRRLSDHNERPEDNAEGYAAMGQAAVLVF